MRTFHFPSIGSTNDEARRLAAEHPGQTLLVTADEQTAGRGRVGRAWRSPRGGAWFTVVMPADRPRPTAPLTVGLAVRRVIAAMIGGNDAVTIKWPNDVLLNGCKVAGVLCEQVFPDLLSTHPDSSPEETGGVTLLLGVGINVNNPVHDLDGMHQPATSLVESLGQPLDVDRLIRHTVETIRQYMRRPFIADDLTPHLAWQGEQVCVTLSDRETRGVITGIDQQGRLLLRSDQGDTVDIDAGDVSRIRKADDQRD